MISLERLLDQIVAEAKEKIQKIAAIQYLDRAMPDNWPWPEVSKMIYDIMSKRDAIEGDKSLVEVFEDSLNS